MDALCAEMIRSSATFAIDLRAGYKHKEFIELFEEASVLCIRRWVVG
jgi:hypothetical protein